MRRPPCDWVKKGLPLCLIADSGTGKSHLLIALGTEAAMAGYRVRYPCAGAGLSASSAASASATSPRNVCRHFDRSVWCTLRSPAI